MRTLIVHNSSSGYGSDAIYEFERALVRPGDECVMRLLYSEEYDRLALSDAERFDVVVISGGDGTVTNCLHILANRDVSCCVFPSGTANLFAANLGNASEPAALAKACRDGITARLDLGEMSWTHEDGSRKMRGFGLMGGSGFDAKLMSAAVQQKKALGEAAYFAAVLANLHPERIHFTIEVDDQIIERDGISCLVANNAMIQGEVQLIPGCLMNDGALDVIVLEVDDTMKLIRPLIRGLVDKEGSRAGRPYLETFRGSSIRVTPDRPIKMEVDGNVIEGDITSWEARVLPAATRLIVDDFSHYAPQEQ